MCAYMAICRSNMYYSINLVLNYTISKLTFVSNRLKFWSSNADDKKKFIS